jgi:hypothetical protein
VIFLQDLYFSLSNEIGYLTVFIKEDKFDVIISNINNQTYELDGISTLNGREIIIEINPSYVIPMPLFFGDFVAGFSKTQNSSTNTSTICLNYSCTGACALVFNNMVFAIYNSNGTYTMVYYNTSVSLINDTMCYSVNTTGSFMLKACVNTTGGVQTSCVLDYWYPYPSTPQFFCLLPSSVFGFPYLLQFLFIGLIDFLLFFAFTKIDVAQGLVVIAIVTSFFCWFNIFCLSSNYLSLFYFFSGVCLLFAGLIFAGRRNWI